VSAFCRLRTGGVPCGFAASAGKATHCLSLAVVVSRVAGSSRVGVGRWLRPGPGRITIRSSRNRFAVRLNSGVRPHKNVHARVIEKALGKNPAFGCPGSLSYLHGIFFTRTDCSSSLRRKDRYKLASSRRVLPVGFLLANRLYSYFCFSFCCISGSGYAQLRGTLLAQFSVSSIYHSWLHSRRALHLSSVPIPIKRISPNICGLKYLLGSPI